MKNAVVLAVFLAVAGNLSGSPQNRPTSHEKHPQPNTSPSTTVINKEQNGSAQTAQTTKQQPPSSDTSSQWALVIVGIITCGVIAYQAFETAGATKAMEENVKAVVGSERPWIIPTIQGDSSFSLIFENQGRTPADIVSVRTRDSFPVRLADLPDAPDYGLPTEFLHQRVLGAGRTWDFPDAFTNIPSISPDETWQEIRASRRRFVFYGVVVYRNLMNQETHETRFCYFYSPLLDRMIIGGPRDYTKYT